MKVTQQPITTAKMVTPVDTSTKHKVLRTLKTLVNNQACLECGKFNKWWVSIIFFVAAMGIAIIPTTVTFATQRGDAILTSNTCGIENGFEDFTHKLNGETYDVGTQTYSTDSAKEVNFVIKPNAEGKNTLTLSTVENWEAICNQSITYETTNDNGQTTSYTYKYYEYVVNTGNKDSNGNIITAPRLRVFFIEDNPNSEENEEKYASKYFFSSNEVFGIELGEEVGTTNYRVPCSFLVLGSNSFYFAKYKPGAIKNSESIEVYSGDYENNDIPQEGLFLKNFVKNSNEPGKYLSFTDSLWLPLFFNGFKNIRKSQTIMMFGITMLINSVMTFLFGVILWLTTLGKNNPNRKRFKFYECLMIAVYASLAPSLLTLAIGFIWTQFASYAFVALMAIRMMWLSMRTMKPIQA